MAGWTERASAPVSSTRSSMRSRSRMTVRSAVWLRWSTAAGLSASCASAWDDANSATAIAKSEPDDTPSDALTRLTPSALSPAMRRNAGEGLQGAQIQSCSPAMQPPEENIRDKRPRSRESDISKSPLSEDLERYYGSVRRPRLLLRLERGW